VELLLKQEEPSPVMPAISKTEMLHKILTDSDQARTMVMQYMLR